MEGDAKAYELIQSLKHEYPEGFHWVYITLPRRLASAKKLPAGVDES